MFSNYLKPSNYDELTFNRYLHQARVLLILSVVLYLTYTALFFYVGISELAVIGGVGLVLSIACWFVLKGNKPTDFSLYFVYLSMQIMASSCAIYASILIGFGSGFFLFLFLIILFNLMVIDLMPAVKIIKTVIAVIISIALAMHSYNFTPTYLLEDFQLNVLYYMNLGSFIVVSIGGSYYHAFQSFKIEKHLSDNLVLDTLTQQYNRFFFNQQVYINRLNLKNNETFYAMVDIDFFKTINDRYGHQIGDKVLVKTAQQLNESLAGLGILYRWGGEEFLIIINDSSYKKVVNLLKKICSDIENLDMCFLDKTNLSINLTVTIGVSCSKEGCSDWQKTIEESDRALYQGKSQGRNQVVFYEAETE